ncbi:putative formaldehyde dehydrogenase AdhA [Phytophthora citrophthora]|uniref:Formaldehyde dehydrogenase AdhA n=1 Tax=Phytophthora citrophthora TaxID=4793 RepID=A0AAD9GY23_9STRA|nr:putative formaldehyde dehydrogenase AdhA [Phytophthora citrophthora]
MAYGGYADYVRVNSNFAFKIPDNIPSASAAPLLCAGVTVCTPLKHNVKPGDRVGVIGIGGLGHLAIQFFHALGATPVAFSRSANKEKEIRALGAEEFYNLSDPKDQQKAISSVNVLLLTADTTNMPYNTYLSLLKKRGTFIMVGVPNDEVKFKPMLEVAKGIKWVGSLIGIQDIKDMLELASEKNVRATVQQMPMSKVNDGIAMMREGHVRYRVVLENQARAKQS